MGEYISRAEVLKHQRKMSGADWGGEFWDFAVLVEAIEKIHAADVVEVRHGYWESRYNEEYKYRCSLCDGGSDLCSDYCPNCGAIMDGKRKDGAEMKGCKWCCEKICTNDESPLVADYCPVPDTPYVCRHEQREDGAE